jgi:hypothetical protein
MLRAIHANEDVAAAREKAFQVIEKLPALRLTTAAELAAARRRSATAAFPRNIGGASGPIIHLNVPCVRSGAHPGGWRFPRWPIGSQPGRGTLAAYRGDRVVD